eukprot:CAMPEP_0184494236 /NCGR_PEP_ID=MMETSP0113_2-20130426/28223_1 /TAXON_ID=91329 /ORGANISM="Norrisiella sphaerica, Strain BC52" /LENGTH=778 /DNA_ID=CAMNT_0026879915 /DNA_START=69 /DNA_END=2408 /DNA_ORIENTATION=-
MNILAQELKARRGIANYVPKRRVIIDPFRHQPRPPADFEEKYLRRLSEAVATIHRKERINFSREELYRVVESLCIYAKATAVYTNLYKQCEAHIQSQIASLKDAKTVVSGKMEVGTSTAESDEMFLTKAQMVWEDHCNHFRIIRSIFLYLDRTFVLSNPKLTSLRGMGLSLLRQTLMSNPHVLQHIVRATLTCIYRDRCGEKKASVPLLKSVLDMLEQLEIYSQVFEGVFLTGTQNFFMAEGMRLAPVIEVPAYLEHISKRLTEEKSRVEKYLAERTRRALVKTIEEALIAKHTETILRRGMAKLVEANSTGDLARMYLLLSRVDSLVAMKKSFLAHLKVAGIKIVNLGDLTSIGKKPQDKLTPQDIKILEEQELKVVPGLLAYKSRLDTLVKEAFGGDSEFSYALKEGFEHFVGSADYRVAELLARHIDKFLRTGTKGMSEQQADISLEPYIVLFGYVQSKDVFKGFYQKDLSSRLLEGKSASKTAEKIMLQKLRNICGAAFTKNMEAMFRDITLSDDIFEEFRRAQANGPVMSTPLPFSVRVLTDGSWPKIDETPNINLPKEIKECHKIFEKFYLKKHKGQKLVWQYPRSTAVLTAEFPKCGKKELRVSAFQAAVLLQMSDRTEPISFDRLCGVIGVDSKNLQQTLTSLVEARLLLKSPPVPKVLPTDLYVTNRAFKTNRIMIKLEQIRQRSRRRFERREVQEQVIADRGVVIDATIVRLMKTRKTVAHKELMSEVVKKVRFACTAGDILKRIEVLLKREYMGRDENNPEIYNYKA